MVAFLMTIAFAFTALYFGLPLISALFSVVPKLLLYALGIGVLYVAVSTGKSLLQDLLKY